MSIFSKFWNWLKSALTKQKIEEVKAEKVEVEEVKAEEQTNPILDKSTKIAIIVGHTKSSPGADNYKKENEFSFNSRIAKKMKAHMAAKYPKKKIKIFFRSDDKYTVAVKKVAAEVGSWKATISLELHFNSYKKKAYGCEILMWANAKHAVETLKIADKITDNLAKEFNLKERAFYKETSGNFADGVKVLGGRARGAANMKACNDQNVKIAMLIEPCFANFETEESRAIFENEDKYAEFLADELAKIEI